LEICADLDLLLHRERVKQARFAVKDSFGNPELLRQRIAAELLERLQPATGAGESSATPTGSHSYAVDTTVSDRVRATAVAARPSWSADASTNGLDRHVGLDVVIGHERHDLALKDLLDPADEDLVSGRATGVSQPSFVDMAPTVAALSQPPPAQAQGRPLRVLLDPRLTV
jgi:hypothetical protein